jgi:hypothetical protein
MQIDGEGIENLLVNVVFQKNIFKRHLFMPLYIGIR